MFPTTLTVLCPSGKECDTVYGMKGIMEVNCGSMITPSNGNIFRVTGPLCGECTGPGEFPTQRPVKQSFDVFFDLHFNKRLSKQPWGWWFETPWSLWCQCNEIRRHPPHVPPLLSWTYRGHGCHCFLARRDEKPGEFVPYWTQSTVICLYVCLFTNTCFYFDKIKQD